MINALAVFDVAGSEFGLCRYLFLPYIPGTGELAVFLGAMAGAGLSLVQAPARRGVHGRRRRPGTERSALVPWRHRSPGKSCWRSWAASSSPKRCHRSPRVLCLKWNGGLGFSMAPLPPFRTGRGKGAGCRPLLDHHHRAGAGRSLHPQVAVTWISGKLTLVLGLGQSGLAMARWLARQMACAGRRQPPSAPPQAAALHRSPHLASLCGPHLLPGLRWKWT